MFIEDHLSSGDGNGLVGIAGDDNGNSVDGKIADGGAASPGGTGDLRGLRGDRIGNNLDAGNGQAEVGERRLRVDLIGITEGRGAEDLGR